MDAARVVPVCKVSVDGQPLELGTQARLVRARIDVDSDLFAESSLLFMDPDLELLNGSIFAPAAKVTVKIGYGAQPGEVFGGEVVRLEPQFRRDQPPALLVICQEPLHRLALSQNTRALNDVDVSEIVSAIAQSHGLTADAPRGSKQHFLQNNLSDAALLRQLASSLGLRVRLEDKKIVMGPPPVSDPMPLSLGDGIKKLKVKRKAGQQVGEVAVHGWDEKQKQEIVGTAKPEGATGKAARDYGAGSLVESGSRLRPTDTASAEAMAKGHMQKLAVRSALLQAELRGDPRYLPGQVLELDKFGYGCDGSYQVERARHEFSRNGYFVKLDAIWTGPKKAPKPIKIVQNVPFEPKFKPKGKLVRPRWKRRSGGSESDTADMAVDSLGLEDGRSVTLVLETRVTGEWREVARASAQVSSGTAMGSSTLDLPASEVLSAPKWTKAKESKHVHGESGEVELTSTAKEGTEVRVILERQLQGHRWEKADSGLAQVSGGKVKTSFDLEHPHQAEAAKAPSEMLGQPRWSGKPQGHDTWGTLEVDAAGLADGRKVRFVVERLGRDQKWAQVKVVEAQVRQSVAQATVLVEHPGLGPQPTDAQHLKAPTWSERDLQHGDTTDVSVDAKELDGRYVKFVVEQFDGKTWNPTGERTVKVQGGKAQAKMSVANPGDEPKSLGALTYDPKTGKVQVVADKLDGRQVRFVLEQRAGTGWTDAGSAVAVAKGGKALAQLSLPRLGSARWGATQVSHGDQIEMTVDAPGLDGATVLFQLERLVGKSWAAAGSARAMVKSGAATASVKVEHPAAGKKGAGAAELALSKLRFKAALQGAVGATRARAELLPDLPAEQQLGEVQHDPKSGEARLAAPGLDGQQVRLILERKVGAAWAEAGAAMAMIKDGAAVATLGFKSSALVNPAWGRTRVAHGDEVEVSVGAPGLAGSQVIFNVERLDRGKWVAAGEASAKVVNGKAVAKVKVSAPEATPARGSQPAVPGRLRFRARVDAASAVTRVRAELTKAPNPLNQVRHNLRTGEAHLKLPGKDGQRVRFVAERKDPSGWVQIGSAVATFAKGIASAKVTSIKQKGTLKNPRWSEKDLTTGDDTSVSVEAEGLDGQLVAFEIERLQGKSWISAGKATARVNSGKAATKVTVAHGGVKGGTAADRAHRKLRFRASVVPGVLENPRWGGKNLADGSSVGVMVDAKGLDGATVQFVVERLQGGQWSAVGTETATVAGEKASASVTVAHGAGKSAPAQDLRARKLRFQAHLIGTSAPVRVRAEPLADDAPRKIRFRAEVALDLGSQKLRFRAEPIPDFSPLRVRFRPIVRIPADPGLTRLRAILVGGDEDQGCQTSPGKQSAN